MSDLSKLTLGGLIRADQRRFYDLNGVRSSGYTWVSFLHPRIAPVAWFRLANWFQRHQLTALATIITQLNIFVFKVEIPARAQIGPGLVLPHPMGIVLGSASIGDNVTIFQNVTLGSRRFDGAYDLSTRPVVGNCVTIGAGAVVLGPVRIEDGTVVRANSLLTHSNRRDCTSG